MKQTDDGKQKTEKKRKGWTCGRHRRVFAFLRAVMTPFFKLRYNYVAEPAPIKSGPCLILHNHQATMDPFFVADSFKFPLYFFASDDLFNLKVSPLIRYLVNPIPKSKSVSDMEAVRIALRVFKEGGAVCIAPEGNRTLSGRQWEMADSAAKLVKLSKVPLVLYNLCGGYGTDPRWGAKIRKGTKYVGRVKRIIYPDEYKNMSVAELFEIIKRERRRLGRKLLQPAQGGIHRARPLHVPQMRGHRHHTFARGKIRLHQMRRRGRIYRKT